VIRDIIPHTFETCEGRAYDKGEIEANRHGFLFGVWLVVKTGETGVFLNRIGFLLP
jgi:hypothetical protein